VNGADTSTQEGADHDQQENHAQILAVAQAKGSTITHGGTAEDAADQAALTEAESERLKTEESSSQCIKRTSSQHHKPNSRSFGRRSAQ
jgi:hypothetical protein